MQAAGCHAREDFPTLRDEFHDFTLAFLWCVAECRLAPHLRAAGLQRKGEVQDAQPLLGERRWRIVLASRNLTRRSHGPMALKDQGTSPARKIQCASRPWCESYMTCFSRVSRFCTASCPPNVAKTIDMSMQSRV